MDIDKPINATNYTITYTVIVPDDVDPNDVFEAALETQANLEHAIDTIGCGDNPCWVNENATTVEETNNG